MRRTAAGGLPARGRAGHQPGPVAGAVRVGRSRCRGCPSTRGRRRRMRRGGLFVERAAMTGWTSSYADDHRRIATICRRLDGMALAIELAAARVATLGLDGLDRELADPLRTADRRVPDGRSGTGRCALALDWSFGLLSDRGAGGDAAGVGVRQLRSRRAAADGRRLRTADARPRWPASLASLAEHSLLVVIDSPAGTRYRMLETIRQYGGRADGPRWASRTTYAPDTWAGAWQTATAAGVPATAERRSTRWPTTCAPRCGWSAGRPT